MLAAKTAAIQTANLGLKVPNGLQGLTGKCPQLFNQLLTTMQVFGR
jgi:hypothetical protein